MELGHGHGYGAGMHHHPSHPVLCCPVQHPYKPTNNQPNEVAGDGAEPLASIAVACVFNCGGGSIEADRRSDLCCAGWGGCLLFVLVLGLALVFSIVWVVNDPHPLSIVVVDAPVVGLVSLCLCFWESWQLVP